MLYYLKKDCNIAEFIKKVNECTGEVYFNSGEGDCLNLKSRLCQYIFAFSSDRPELLENAAILCSQPEDASILAAYIEQRPPQGF
jgi:hypothetical protein